MSRRVAVLALVLLGSVLVTGALATSHFSITASPSVEVPERTVTHNEQEYTISAIARIDPDGSVTVSSDVPEDTLHTVYLYNDEQKIEHAERGFGDLEFTVDAETLSEGPGSYVLVLEKDTVRTVHPVVVSEYRVTIDAPESVSDGQTLEVSGTIERLVENESDAEVTAVVGNDSERVTTTATIESGSPDGSYTASVPTDELPPGTYSAYAVVRGPETVSGTNELIGLSDAHQVEIGAATDDSEASTSSGSGTSPTTESGSATTRTPQTTTTTATDPQSGSDETGTSITTPADGTSETIATTTAGDAPTTTATTTTSEVLTPNQDSPTETTVAETPLSGAIPVVAIFGAVALLGYRRHRKP